MKLTGPPALRFLALLLICQSFMLNAQNSGMSVSQSGVSADPSAMLDVISTDKGFLMPRMTESQRDSIQNPAEGLQIYNTTTGCYNMWDGGAWKQSCYDCSFPVPTPSSNGPLCEGDSLKLFATTLAGATYSWTGPNGFSSSQQNPSISNATVAATGIYSLVVTYNGCSAQPIQVQVTVSTSPGAPTAGSNSPQCVGGDIQLTASTIAGASYSWTGPNGFSSTNQNPIISGFSLADTGYYYVSANVNGCNSGLDSVLFQTYPSPAAPAAITGDASPCANATNEVYSISPVNGASSYIWTVPAGATIIAGQGTTSITVNWGTSSGNVCVSSVGTCDTSSATCQSITLGSGASGSQSFYFTGSFQTFTVPPCVSSVIIQVWGAQGGNSGGLGGRGGYSAGTLSVSPGETLYVYVGGQGGNNLLCNGTGAGFNGGGAVAASCCSASGSGSAGGGGATDVRQGGSSLNDRVIVAGGGGGAGSGIAGAVGGGSVGGDGTTYNGQTCTGGTQTTGGNPGGNYSGCTNAPATAGVFGQGGSGDANDGGGGGGGWYGGGGGGNNGPGGGGSGYIGGVTGGSTSPGLRPGNGECIISW